MAELFDAIAISSGLNLRQKLQRARGASVSAMRSIIQATSVAAATARLDAQPLTEERYREFFDLLLPIISEHYNYGHDDHQQMIAARGQSDSMISLVDLWLVEAYTADLKLPGAVREHAYRAFMGQFAGRASQGGTARRPSP